MSTTDQPVVNEPVSYPGQVTTPPENRPKPLTVDEVNSLVPEEIPTGTMGWVELDEQGRPSGQVTAEPPPIGTVAARVMVATPIPLENLVTPSGAPITAQMNPSPVSLYDEGFLDRNPPDGQPKSLYSNNKDVSPDNPERPTNMESTT